MNLFLSSAGLALVILLAEPGAATVCVNPKKSSCQPTLQQGVDAASPGELVKVKKGVYAEEVVIATPGVVLKGSKSAIVQGLPGGASPLISVQANDVTIDGLTVRHGDHEGIRVEPGVTGTTIEKVAVQATGDACIAVEDAAHGTIVEGSLLAGCSNGGLIVGGGGTADGLLARRIRIGRLGGVGIDVDGNGATLEGNQVRLVGGIAIRVTGSGASVVGNQTELTDGGVEVDGDLATIDRNRISRSDGRPGIDLTCDPCSGGLVTQNSVSQAMDDDGIRLDVVGGGVEVSGNRVDRAAGDGISTRANTDGVTLANNSVTRCQGAGLSIEGSGHALDHNSVTGCAGDGFAVGGTGHLLTGNVARANLEDGLDVVDAGPTDGVTLEGNKALGNFGVGLAVSLGATNTTLTGNKAKKSQRADLCDAGTGTTLTDNKVGTTEVPAADCPVD